MCGMGAKFNLHSRVYGQPLTETEIENWLWHIEAYALPAIS